MSGLYMVEYRNDMQSLRYHCQCHSPQGLVPLPFLFAKDAKLLKGLVRMIKKGKVTPDVHRSMWPTYVERKEGRDKPWIQAWAAAGAVG